MKSSGKPRHRRQLLLDSFRVQNHLFRLLDLNLHETLLRYQSNSSFHIAIVKAAFISKSAGLLTGSRLEQEAEELQAEPDDKLQSHALHRFLTLLSLCFVEFGPTTPYIVLFANHGIYASDTN